MRSMKPILLLEDDSVDAMTVRRAMKDLSVVNSLVRVVNGEEAIEYLNNKSNPMPCLILLDLNMPKMSGCEFLKIIKDDPVLKSIPVIVLTTSRADSDKFECFNRSIAGYIVKPTDYDDFVNAIKILDLYWTLSELPAAAVEEVDANLEKTVAK